MAQLALGAGNAHIPGVLAEDAFDGGRLGGVTQGGARAVGVDVVDVGRVEGRVTQCGTHGPGRSATFGIGGRHVRAVGRHAVAEQLGQNLGTAAFGVLQYLPARRCRPLPKARSRRDRDRTVGWQPEDYRCGSTGPSCGRSRTVPSGWRLPRCRR